MADIFGRSNQIFAGGFPVDGARIAFAGNDGEIVGVGMLTQNLNYNYAQPITILYELGTNNAYIVTGRARGGVAISRVHGERALVKSFYAKYGDVCNAATNILNLDSSAPGCGDSTPDGARASLSMSHCLVETMAGTVASDNGLMTENVNMRFLSLEVN